tara:strand:+ start:517 stop:1551 length:1035 start_codon:yes stop_codon:yes gene_type:complete
MFSSLESPETFVIAEAGVNHNGSLDIALKLCDQAKIAGANAIKFQTWITDNIVLKGAPQAIYQELNTQKRIDQYSLLKELELSFDDFVKINEYCKSIDLEFLSTPDDKESLNFLVNKIGLETIKVGSGEITNLPFLREIGKLSKKIILSTGMSNMEDIDCALKALGYPNFNRLILLHCTSSYPCPYQNTNLKVIITFKERYKYKIGFSDHTMGISAAIGAVAMGAEVIEKHFTLDKSMDGPDHKCSLETDEFKDMVNHIRIIEKTLGSPDKAIQDIEKDTKEKVTKMIVSRIPINEGTIFSEDNLNLLRSGSGFLNGQNWYDLIGKKAKRNYGLNEPIDFSEIK